MGSTVGADDDEGLQDVRETGESVQGEGDSDSNAEEELRERYSSTLSLNGGLPSLVTVAAQHGVEGRAPRRVF